jgi:hypothetical protein
MTVRMSSPENGEAKAFLPSAIATSFPTMRRSVCATPEVRFSDLAGHHRTRSSG